jgi:spore coat polysaccharide biosynthesis predicted glycosyltransferase SpsG/folate-dependent phosphoribosylglycinamide formyltransferase PurN
MRENPESLSERVRDSGFKVVNVPALNLEDSSNPFALDAERDAKHFINLCSGLMVDWVLVDHYGANVSWETLVAERFPTMAIDDFSDRPHKTQIVINPNLLSAAHESLFARNSKDSTTVTGVDFIPISPNSSYPHFSDPNVYSANQPISIYFGASDSFGLTHKVAKVLLQDLKLPNSIHVLVGLNSRSRREILDLAETHANLLVHNFTDDLGSIFSVAPISIGAGGSTVWERLLYQNHCLVFAIADNQVALSESLSSLGVIEFAGLYSESLEPTLTQTINDFISSLPFKNDNFLKLDLDRHGASRIAALISVSEGDSDSFNLGVPSESNEEVRSSGLELFWRDLQVCTINVSQSDSQVSFSIEDCNFAHSIETAAGLNLDSIVCKLLQLRYPQLYLSNSSTPKFKILFLLSPSSWINDFIWDHLGSLLNSGYSVKIAHEILEEEHADICVLLGFEELISPEQILQFKSVVVVHESDLPRGRGWSPMTWRILNGEQSMILTLFQAAEKVDRGVIYGTREVALNGVEMLIELREIQISQSLKLISEFVEDFPNSLIKARAQVGEPTYFPRRTKIDSHCNSDSTLDSIFDLLRVSDSRRYPVYFKKNGFTFSLRLDRISNLDEEEMARGKGEK